MWSKLNDPQLLAEYNGTSSDQKSDAPMQEQQTNNSENNKSLFNMDEKRYPEFQKNMKESGKMAMAAAPAIASVFQPEIPVAGALGAGVNALARIGGGTAANTLSDIPQIHSVEDFKNALKQNTKLNTIIEGVAHIPKAMKAVGEVFNPISFAAKQAAEHKNQYEIAVKAQEAAYDPVMKKYGSQQIAPKGKDFLGYGTDTTKYFTPEVKKVYGDLLKNPIFENLHIFQSQLGKDAARLSSNTNKINTYQALTDARKIAKQKAEDFLSKDKKSLEDYLLGSKITKNEVMPNLANPKLAKIAEGTITNPSPQEYVKAIEKGQEKKLYQKNGKNVYAIPEGHHLSNSLKSLKNRIHLGEAAQVVLPTLAGGIAGEFLSPGPGGAAAGGGAGLIASGANAVSRKLGGVGIGNLVQNPLVEKITRDYINPLFYGAARTYTGYKK